MAPLNYTTKIDADKTAAEIAKCLSSHGVQRSWSSTIGRELRHNAVIRHHHEWPESDLPAILRL